MKPYKRLLIVFLLGFSSGLPFSLLVGTLQAWFSTSGASVLATGMLSLIGLPYGYRFFWGPLLDRFTLGPLGKRRSWILLTQIILCLGFNGMAWCSPISSPGPLLIFAVVLAFISATQDIAIDAQRIEYLPQEEYGLGASLGIFGYRAALLVSGGLALLLAQYWGFAWVYRLMGGLMGLCILVTLYCHEPEVVSCVCPQGSKEAFLEPLRAVFRRPGVISFFIFIICYKLGEAFTGTMSGIMVPFLIQGMGFSLATIGYINKLMGLSALIIGGFLAGILLTRWRLERALWVFGLMQAFSCLWFIALAVLGKHLIVFACAVLCENLASGMSWTALVVLFMRWVDRRYTGTQFSFLVGIAMLPRAFSGPIAASIQAQVGWVGLYQCAFGLSLLFLPFLFYQRAWIASQALMDQSAAS